MKIKAGNLGKIMTSFLMVVTAFPLFSLILKGWVSAILYLSAFISLILLVRKVKIKYFQNREKNVLEVWLTEKNIFLNLVIISFCLQLITVFVVQTLHGNYMISRYDAPLRYLLGVIILLAIIVYKPNIKTLFLIFISLAPIVTYFLIPFVPKTFWSTQVDRLSNHFIDPLIFGYVSLSLGTLSAINWFYSSNKISVKSFIYFFGAVSGAYLSLRSGSRTGWFALPIVFFLFIFFDSRLGNLNKILLSSILTVVIGMASYNLSDVVKNRVDSMAAEISAYQWNEVTDDSSIGHRISWARIGLYYFSIHPLVGWNEKDLRSNINDDFVSSFSSQSSREELIAVGFHSDYFSRLVRYGILGIFSLFMLFAAPLIFFWRFRQNHQVLIFTRLGIAYVIFQAIGSLTYHILDFKFMASFYSMMIAVLVGLIINNKDKI
jgi:O-antigen ligase